MRSFHPHYLCLKHYTSSLPSYDSRLKQMEKKNNISLVYSVSTLTTTGRKTPLPAFPIHSSTTRGENLKTAVLVFSKTDRALSRIRSLHSHPCVLQTVNEYGTMRGKGDFVGVTRRRTLRWRCYPGQTRWASVL